MAKTLYGFNYTAEYKNCPVFIAYNCKLKEIGK
jgi:hypothetical protein